MDVLDGPHPGEDITNLFCVFHPVEKQSSEVNITANTGGTSDQIYQASISCTTEISCSEALRVQYRLKSKISYNNKTII